MKSWIQHLENLKKLSMIVYSRKEADLIMLRLVGYSVHVTTTSEQKAVAMAMYPIMIAIKGTTYNRGSAEGYARAFRLSGDAKSRPYMDIGTKRMGHHDNSTRSPNISFKEFMYIVSPSPLKGVYE